MGSTTSTSRSSASTTTTGTKPNIDGIDFKIFKDDETAFLEFKAGNLDLTQIPSGQIKATADRVRRERRRLHRQPRQAGPERSARLAIYYLIHQQHRRVVQERRSPQGHLAGHQPPGHLRHRLRGHRVARHRASSRRASPATKTDAWAVLPSTTWKPPKPLWRRPAIPDGKGLPEHQAGVQQRRRPRRRHGSRPGRPAKPSASTSSSTASECARRTWTSWATPSTRSAASAGSPTTRSSTTSCTRCSTASRRDNYSKYNNPAVDAAINDARTTADADARIAAYQAVVKTIGDDAPVIPHRHLPPPRRRLRPGQRPDLQRRMGLLDFDRLLDHPVVRSVEPVASSAE